MDVIKRNNINISGKGEKPLVFGHGFGCDQNMWRFVTPAFQQHYKIVLFDHVGAGNSDLAAYDIVKYNTLHGYATDILEIIDTLDLQDVIFVGHSVSAMMGVLSAIKIPALFSKLVLIGPSPCYINDKNYIGGFDRADILSMLAYMDRDYTLWADTFAPLIMGNPDKPSLGEELIESFCNTDPDIARHFAHVTFLSDNRQDLPKLQTEALIMQCADDIIAPEEVGNYVHKAIKNSTLVHLKATGHCPNLSAPLEVIDTMENYLQV
ncbi:alpha/beta fold hydrolase [Pontibacter sp. BAB1700]|uniref:alpha/beta fold hydrolase n=1 Tax=Pontibacter sp. BAB1700 TaxID=1144253 RepID=UPI00026BD954|nr:alpha/beta hydrolase [Pontibacter sp. BAB1700]EJF11511.1 alpha/beta hydrolase fold protein [Pontibacter sp. BAB1700]